MIGKDRGLIENTIALYLAWAVVFIAAFGAGGYTLSLLMDAESLGTANHPNVIEAADDFSNIGDFGNTDTNNPETSDTSSNINDSTSSTNTNDSGTSDTTSDARTSDTSGSTDSTNDSDTSSDSGGFGNNGDFGNN